MIVISIVCPKLKAVKDLVREMSKNSCFRTLLGSQHVKGSQTLVKSTWENFYHILSPLWGNLVSKMSPLVIYEILGVFVNALAVDDKYPLRNCVNLSLSIQTKLYKKATKKFLSILCSIIGIYIKFQRFCKISWLS